MEPLILTVHGTSKRGTFALISFSVENMRISAISYVYVFVRTRVINNGRMLITRQPRRYSRYVTAGYGGASSRHVLRSERIKGGRPSYSHEGVSPWGVICTGLLLFSFWTWSLIYTQSRPALNEWSISFGMIELLTERLLRFFFFFINTDHDGDDSNNAGDKDSWCN